MNIDRQRHRWSWRSRHLTCTCCRCLSLLRHLQRVAGRMQRKKKVNGGCLYLDVSGCGNFHSISTGTRRQVSSACSIIPPSSFGHLRSRSSGEINYWRACSIKSAITRRDAEWQLQLLRFAGSFQVGQTPGFALKK
jgi:hypothetical protein